MPQPLPNVSRHDALACHRSLRGGSKSFFAASLVLPPWLRRRASAVYAFCRLADDLIDEGGGAPAVALLSERLDAIYAGRPHPHAADRALARTLREVRLPRESFDALLEGFAWDAASRRYETIEDLQDYAARVAGSVGVLMSVAMERCAPHVLARPADLGVAMQLTNIARDVGEDARAGRLYLPLQWFREAGIDPDAFLAAPRFSPALAGVVQRLLGEAERLYTRADAGLSQLPATCRPGIGLARKLYAAIGDEIAHNGFDSVSTRAVVPTARKLTLALTPGATAARSLDAPPLAATAFIVEAASMRGFAFAPSLPAWWDMRGRFLQVLAIFERLERAERSRA